MRTTLAKTASILLAATALPLLATAPGGAGQNQDAKRAPSVAELKARLKAGTFKLTEAEVVKLVGPPAGVRRPGENRSEHTMHWDFATTIVATFKDGKLSGASGAFSEHLPVERVSLASFKRLRVGMTEAQVVEVLGKENGTATAGTTATHAWGRTARLTVSFNSKGLAFAEGLVESGALPAPGFPLPVPGAGGP